MKILVHNDNTLIPDLCLVQCPLYLLCNPPAKITSTQDRRTLHRYDYVHVNLYAKLVAVAFDLDTDTVFSVTRMDTEMGV